MREDKTFRGGKRKQESNIEPREQENDYGANNGGKRGDSDGGIKCERPTTVTLTGSCRGSGCIPWSWEASGLNRRETSKPGTIHRRNKYILYKLRRGLVRAAVGLLV